MEKQIKGFIETRLSINLCGFRKGYNTQYALTAMIERRKRQLDKNGGMAGGILMDLTKAFDTINHELLIAKLEAYSFNHGDLSILLNFRCHNRQGSKI